MKRIDWPLLVMALAATTAIGYFTGNQVYASRCKALGGRVMHFGADRPCMLPDRSRVQVGAVLPASPEGRAILVVTLAATAGGIYLGLLRITRPGLTRQP